MSEFMSRIKRFFTNGSKKEDGGNVYFALSSSKKTIDAIIELADITGIKMDEGVLAKFFQDSVRTLEWILYYQSKGREISALGEKEIDVLKRHLEPNDKMPSLSSFIAPGKESQAKEYFKSVPENYPN